MKRVAVAVLTLAALLTACGSSGNTSGQAVKDLQATVAALQRQLAVTPAPTESPPATPSPTPSPVPTESPSPTPGPSPERHTLQATIAAPTCNGSGYDLFTKPVAVKDEKGVTIATGTRTSDGGPPPNEVVLATLRWHSDRYCQAGFTIDVPRAEFYQLVVGSYVSESRSFADLEQGAWHMVMTFP